MVDYSLCALDPKPFDYCKHCYRNPDNTEPSKFRQSYIAPACKYHCEYYIPIGPLEIRYVRPNERD